MSKIKRDLSRLKLILEKKIIVHCVTRIEYYLIGFDNNYLQLNFSEAGSVSKCLRLRETIDWYVTKNNVYVCMCVCTVDF